jgi:hypothetical protein
MPNQNEQRDTPFSYKEGVLLIIGFIVVSIVFAAFVGLVNAYSSSIALPMLSIAGIVLLLLCLTAISYVFVRAGLQDKSQALGLPAGSIQAVIALSLIVLFAILTVFIFTSMGTSLRTLTGLTLAERDDQISKLGSIFAGWQQTGDQRFTIFLRDPVLDARNDIGKQIIVLIGTLMTSAVSFYFGSRATATGAAIGSETAGAGTTTTPDRSSQAEPVLGITKIEPAEVRNGQSTQVTITGSGLKEVASVQFKQGTEVLEVTSIKPNDSVLVCTVNPTSISLTGNYDVVLTTAAGTQVSRGAALKVVDQ